MDTPGDTEDPGEAVSAWGLTAVEVPGEPVTAVEVPGEAVTPGDPDTGIAPTVGEVVFADCALLKISGVVVAGATLGVTVTPCWPMMLDTGALPAAAGVVKVC